MTSLFFGSWQDVDKLGRELHGQRPSMKVRWMRDQFQKMREGMDGNDWNGIGRVMTLATKMPQNRGFCPVTLLTF